MSLNAHIIISLTACKMKLVSRFDFISTEDDVLRDFGLLNFALIKIDCRQDTHTVSLHLEFPFPYTAYTQARDHNRGH